MNERAKKVLVISLFILSVFGIGFALYFTFFRAEPIPPAPTVAPETAPGAGAVPLPSAAVGGARDEISVPTAPTLPTVSQVARGGATATTTLTTAAIEHPAIGTDGISANYYDPNDGRFYKIDKEGNAARISDQTFPNVKNVSWNGTSDKAVLEFPDGANIVYDFATQKQTSLPAHWEDFEFSPVQDQIIAKSIGLDPNNRWLVVTNADGSNAKTIQALGDNADKVTVSWSPNDQIVAFSDTADSLDGGPDRKMILPIGKNNENMKGLIVEGYGFTPVWSDDGKKLLYSAAGDYSNLKPLLWMTDATQSTMGQNRKSLGLNTWADKCAFAGGSVAYCAVPTSLPSNAGLQRELFRSIPDNLYKVDMATGTVSLVAIPENDRVIERPTISTDGSTLYFQNGDSGQLEFLRLK